MAEMKLFQGDLAMALEPKSLTELLVQDIRKLMILEPKESSKAAKANSLALLAAGTNLVYGFASVKPSAVSTSSSSFNLLIYEPRIFIRPLERDRPEYQTEKVLCLTEEEKKQLHKRPSRPGAPDLRQSLLDDMTSLARRFLPPKKHGSTLKLMGKMLAEADDFWPVPVDDNPDVQEILSAVIAFKELTAWYVHRPAKSAQGEAWLILEMLQTLAEEIHNSAMRLQPFPYLLRHLMWCLDLLFQDPSCPSLPGTMWSASWRRSFEALQRKLQTEVDEDAEAEEDAKIDEVPEKCRKAPETEENPKVPKHEAEKAQQIPESKAPKEKKKKETEEIEKIAKKIPMAAEKRQTAKGQGGGRGKTRKTQKRNKKTTKGSRTVRKDKNKEKDEKMTTGSTEVKKDKLDTKEKPTDEYSEAYLRHLRCLERLEEIEEFKARRRREIKEERRRKREEEEAAEAAETEQDRRRRLLFGLAM